MVTHSYRGKEHVAALIEQMLLSLRPRIYEESRLMELTLPQFRTLILLYVQGPLRMSNISCQLGVGMPAVTSLVSKLEEKGLVSREHNTEDRRVVFCSATQQGKAEVERFWRVGREQIIRIIGSLSEEEGKLVARAMELVLRAVKGDQKAERDQEQEVRPGGK
jgi:DNA-binding MarR family transcriptional regulator